MLWSLKCQVRAVGPLLSDVEFLPALESKETKARFREVAPVNYLERT